jgi:hypothetical protein
MKRLILAALLLAAPAFSQRENVTQLVQLKYAEPDQLRNLIQQFGVNVTANGQMKALVLNGPQPNMDAALAALAKLDVAPKNIELVVHFVVGSDQGASFTTGSVAVPAEIRDVIAQLKSTFTFKDYRMLDTLTIRTRTGSNADTTGILSAGANPRLSMFSIRNATVSEDGTTIRIDRMHAGLRIPIATGPKVDYMNTGIDQDIDVKEGQKVVVGRASLEGPEKALFLILTARVIQ